MGHSNSGALAADDALQSLFTNEGKHQTPMSRAPGTPDSEAASRSLRGGAPALVLGEANRCPRGRHHYTHRLPGDVVAFCSEERAKLMAKMAKRRQQLWIRTKTILESFGTPFEPAVASGTAQWDREVKAYRTKMQFWRTEVEPAMLTKEWDRTRAALETLGPGFRTALDAASREWDSKKTGPSDNLTRSDNRTRSRTRSGSGKTQILVDIGDDPDSADSGKGGNGSR